MSQAPGAIESPCTGVCTIAPAARICRGCLRSIDEITQWARLTPQARREIMRDLPARAPLLDD
ncbi:conserved domain protein [Citreicella sp. SE45]|uniref:DUF1289 domain-containing protein n=1 Tax=Salipiger thiooxidans TaxID=282683 RepID=A0A1G7BXD2_9RHOB|nr:MULTISPECIES: DUF1289 domain-containing protein [Salipiger]EEX15505.1 conserved domain protein [Citreicella sp. SE45]MBR9841271.1 DUF1289 domain-containing protein [Paracoccaceae bacterium]MBN8187455.1 DUF1289 domain-containing protein [Salipiger thiooxidans]NIY97241.1 DUF1289 domain-containing protein [Salipiger sp. HF18]NVK59483.1 DUF1289 domain-containing protein [Paracoccaceae bacterium]